jgi:hypothetical protein
MTIHESAPDRSLSKGAILALSVLLIGAVLILYFVFQPRIVPGQELVDIQSIEILREQFNADAGKTRLILIASPT